MRLAHLHLPKPIPYAHSLRLQESLLARHFVYSDATRRSPSSTDGPAPAPPDPTILTFSTEPTYTVGRRHLKSNLLSDDQIAFLSQGDGATFFPSPRGGLLTYHAPGQLTVYPIISLRRHGITPRCYIRLLENTVIATCKKLGVPNTTTTDDPGVWITDPKTGEPPDRKVCAIGVQVSRGITSHGIGLNAFDHQIPADKRDQYEFADGQPAGSRGYLSWGFLRFVACGLEGKSVTWLAREGAGEISDILHPAEVFAEEFAAGLTSQGKERVNSVYRISEEDLLD